ncbi:MAG: NERD domain-containing protein [Bacilli bacterium]|nr:NERD domain-containing protein [Bacilli bacterium]
MQTFWYVFLVFGVLLLLVFFGTLFYIVYKNLFPKKKQDEEKLEEYAAILVSDTLEQLSQKYNGYHFSDFYIYDRDNHKRVSHIDELFLCEKGIYVIKTKYVKGKILGDDNEDNWISKVDENETRFLSPVKENELSLIRMAKMFNESPYFNIVLLLGKDKDLTQLSSRYVYSLNELDSFIESNPNTISKDNLKALEENITYFLKKHGDEAFDLYEEMNEEK